MTLSDKQTELMEALKSRKFRYLLYGGAWGGGKSYIVIGTLHELAMAYPETRWVILRKNLTTIKKSAVKTFEKILKQNNDYRFVKDFNRTDWIVHYKNGSELLFMEADITKDPELNKLRGTEFTGGAMEEANEMDYQVFNAMIGRVGRWNNHLLDGYSFIFLTCNPSQGWCKDVFYDPWSNGELKAPYYYLPALPSDNPHNTKEYLESLKDLPDAEYKRFVEGDWNFATEDGQLLQSDWLKNSEFEASEFTHNLADRTVLGIDPARTGTDKTMFAYIQKGKLFKFEEIASDDVVYTAGIAMERMKEYNIKGSDVIVDVIGVGAGVVDTLRNNQQRCVAFNSGEKPKTTVQFFNFKNRRAEAYWLFREAIRKGDLEVIIDKEFKRQMLNTLYETKEKYIQIIAKEDIKKRLSGRSPDHADAAVMAFYQYQSRPGNLSTKMRPSINTYVSQLNY